MFSFIGAEIRVIAVVVAGLVVGELGLRSFGHKLSYDVSHLQSFNEVASHFGDAESGEVEVLFLGNSMTRYGVNTEVFDETVHEYWDGSLEVSKLNPDNTALADWAVVYDNFFYKHDRAPDLLVIGFEGNHLADKPSNHRNRLAYYYFDEDLTSLRQYDLRSLEELAQFEAAHYSSLLANRDRVQTRVLDAAIPQYRDGIQELNRRQKVQACLRADQPTYERLAGLLKHLEQQQVNLAVVAMPVVQQYEIDSELLELLAKHSVFFMDCRHITGITNEMIPDGVHLNPQAAVIYSQHLARELASPKLHMLTLNGKQPSFEKTQ